MLLETTNLATSKINWYFFECEFSSALLLSTEPYQLVYAGEIAAKNENQRSSQHRMSKIFWSWKKNHEISSPTFFDQHHFEFFFENKVSERYFDFWLLCPTKQTTAKVLPNTHQSHQMRRGCVLQKVSIADLQWSKRLELFRGWTKFHVLQQSESQQQLPQTSHYYAPFFHSLSPGFKQNVVSHGFGEKLLFT